jgi:hypothetical protein
MSKVVKASWSSLERKPPAPSVRSRHRFRIRRVVPAGKAGYLSADGKTSRAPPRQVH